MSDDLPLTDDLALTAARFGTALRAAGVPADPGRCQRFARAVTVARPVTGRALYLCALATLISSQAQIGALDQVFGEMFGNLGDEAAQPSGPPSPGAPDADARPQPDRPSPADLLAQAASAARAIGQRSGVELRVTRVPPRGWRGLHVRGPRVGRGIGIRPARVPTRSVEPDDPALVAILSCRRNRDGGLVKAVVA